MKNTPDTERSKGTSCCTRSCSCGQASIGRRNFIKATGLTAAMLAAGQAKLMAGPFSKEDFEEIIPSDKKLSKEWVASLYARGKPLSATGDDLKYIGMPINGICTGQVYLGGNGRLWCWNLDGARDAKHKGSGPRFLNPDLAYSPMSQGFALQAGGKVFTLDGKGFKDVRFTNQYPMATVDYADSACPVDVRLQAYTPFIPLNRDDSSRPVIVMRYTIRNTSDRDQDLALAGWIENMSNFRSGKGKSGVRLSRYCELPGLSAVECWAKATSPRNEPPETEVFADFEGGTYGDWKVEGKAFGDAPSSGSRTIQKLSGFKGKGVVNSWTGTDALRGKLISPEFTIRKPFINFLVGGGRDLKTLNISLWVGGEKVRSSAGKQSDAMAWACWNVSKLQGKQAHIEILDASSRGWGHIDVDHIVFSTKPPGQPASVPLERATDNGAIALGLLGEEKPDFVQLNRSEPGPAGIFEATAEKPKSGDSAEALLADQRFAAVGRAFTLKPGEEKTVSFALSWRFPNANYITRFGRRPGSPDINHYATLWPTAVDAAGSVAVREKELHATTQTWVDTWYDSTLPYWFLERTFVTLNCMQTQVAERLAGQDGMYNLDEGVNCCPGNCTHVWQYAQGLARIFPVIERECRNQVEYGKGFKKGEGSINFRHSIQPFKTAIDGNCGTILRVLRESQMTTDYRFLESIWERVKLSMDYVIKAWDPDEDGLLEGAQHNTLDEPWFGQVHWLINLYHAALKASAVMARRMNQPAVARRYEAIVAKGAPAMVDLLWNEEFGYFIHKPGPADNEKHGSTNGCHIDQVFGDSWAWNVGIDRILPQDRNPYNEIECSDHYARAMASYGAFMAVCGYQYDGPEGKLAFGPRMQQDDFRAAFTTAEGWGRFSQTVKGGRQDNSIELRYGKLHLKELALEAAPGTQAGKALVKLDGRDVDARSRLDGERTVIQFPQGIHIVAGQTLQVQRV